MTRTNTKSSAASRTLRGGNKQRDDVSNRDKGQGIVRDDRGQEQPADKRRAQHDAGLRAQKEAAEQKNIPAPGEPARGE